MNQKPSKETVRHYMERRRSEHRPPPGQDEIRRQLGWNLIAMERCEQERRSGKEGA